MYGYTKFATFATVRNLYPANM